MSIENTDDRLFTSHVENIFFFITILLSERTNEGMADIAHIR